MSDIQYVQRPFQQFCTKTIYVHHVLHNLPLCSTNNHPCSPFSKKNHHTCPSCSTTNHYAPSIFPEQTASFSNMFPWIYKKHRLFPPFFHPFSSMFQPFSNHFRSNFPPTNANFPRIFPGFSQPAPAVSTVLPPRHCPKALAAWRSSRTPSCLASRCFSKAVARLLKRGSLVHGEMLSEGSENGEWSGWWSSHIWNGNIKAMIQTTNQYIYIHIDLL